MCLKNETEEIQMNNGNKLKILRSENGFSQREIAEKLRMSKSKYCRLENNETELSYDELKLILDLYKVSYDDFSGISLPIIRKVSFKKEILDNLQKVINDSREFKENWNENRTQFNKLRDALDPVIKAKEKALDLPNIDLKDIETGVTIKSVTLDTRGEKLINECLRLQGEYCKRLFGGVE